MRKILWIACSGFFLISSLASAQGADTPAQETAQENVMDRVTDWWATLGKSNEEKTLILEERQMKRQQESSQPAVSVVKEQIKGKSAELKEAAAQKAASAKDAVTQKCQDLKDRSGAAIAQQKTKVKNHAGKIVEDTSKKITDFLK